MPKGNSLNRKKIIKERMLDSRKEESTMDFSEAFEVALDGCKNYTTV